MGGLKGGNGAGDRAAPGRPVTMGSAMNDDQIIAAVQAATAEQFAAINARLDGIDNRLDELTAEVSLQRAALERFGFMGKAPEPPAASGSSGGGAGVPMAAKGKE